MEEKNIYHCYSKRQALFIMSFGVKYEYKDINSNTKVKFYAFKKSKKLDDIIKFYSEVKYKFS